MGKEMEGDSRERAKRAREARAEGKSASEIGATRGASKQRTRSSRNMTHQEKLDLKRQGKEPIIRQNTPEAKPGTRDDDSPDHERYPRL